MSVNVTIEDGALAKPQATVCPGAGAVVVFEGVVREMEDGRRLDALHYETYEPMAQNMLRAIANELVEHYGLIAMHITHSRGRVGVGECSFQLTIASPHREQALAAMDSFIDRMKQDVPIWKRAVWADETVVPGLSEPRS